MKSLGIFLRATCLACWIMLPLAASAGELPDPRTLTSPPLKFTIPRAERVVLNNGMVVYLMEDHELPQINITVLIGTGSVFDPAAKVGLAGLTGAVMRSGGTTSLPAQKIDDELEFMASSIESSIGADVGTVSLVSLTKNFDRTLQIFS